MAEWLILQLLLLHLFNRSFINYGVYDIKLVDYIKEMFLIHVNKLR